MLNPYHKKQQSNQRTHWKSAQASTSNPTNEKPSDTTKTIESRQPKKPQEFNNTSASQTCKFHQKIIIITQVSTNYRLANTKWCSKISNDGLYEQSQLDYV